MVSLIASVTGKAPKVGFRVLKALRGESHEILSLVVVSRGEQLGLGFIV